MVMVSLGKRESRKYYVKGAEIQSVDIRSLLTFLVRVWASFRYLGMFSVANRGDLVSRGFAIPQSGWNCGCCRLRHVRANRVPDPLSQHHLP